MNKKEFLEKVNSKLDSKVSVKVIDAVFDTIADTLANGEDVLLRGFGKFYVKDKSPKVAENGGKKKAPKFKAYDDLKNKVND